jgi:hypothetical protein
MQMFVTFPGLISYWFLLLCSCFTPEPCSGMQSVSVAVTQNQGQYLSSGFTLVMIFMFCVMSCHWSSPRKTTIDIFFL